MLFGPRAKPKTSVNAQASGLLNRKLIPMNDNPPITRKGERFKVRGKDKNMYFTNDRRESRELMRVVPDVMEGGFGGLSGK